MGQHCQLKLSAIVYNAEGVGYQTGLTAIEGIKSKAELCILCYLLWPVHGGKDFGNRAQQLVSQLLSTINT